MQPVTLGVLSFGTFELDLDREQLRKSGVRLKLRPQAFRVLKLLASRSGDLVTREEIQNEIWSDNEIVDFEQGLNFCIRQIRSALTDNADVPRFVETVPRRGYRFIAPVRTSGASTHPDDAPSPLPASAPIATREVELEPASAGPPPVTIAPLAQTGRRRFVALLVILGVAVGFAALIVRYRRGSDQPTAPVPIRSLAVLPLANLSGDPAQQFFTDGMTEALIDHLSALQNVRVVSRTSVMQFRASGKPAPVIAKELNVDALVEGAVLQSAGRVRISVRLIRGGSEKNVWSNVYERKLSDVLGLQRELGHAITRQIERRLTGGTATAQSRTVDPSVYESYLKGRFYLNKGSRTGIEESVRYFDKAIAADPTFAKAFSALGLAYTALGSTTAAASAVSDAQPRALAAARKALELDPNLAEAHTVLAAALERDWQWSESEKEYRRALELDPNNTLALSNLGDLLVARMRPDEGLDLVRRARELDPLRLAHSAQIGWLLYQVRRYDEAARELRTAFSLDPNHRHVRWFLAFVLIEQKQFDEAIRLLDQTASQSERNPAELGILARAYARAGRRDEALHIVRELNRRRRLDYVPPAPFVHAYLGLGDDAEAFRWLDRAVKEHSNLIRYLRTHPVFDPLRHDPRFIKLVQRVQL